MRERRDEPIADHVFGYCRMRKRSISSLDRAVTKQAAADECIRIGLEDGSYPADLFVLQEILGGTTC